MLTKEKLWSVAKGALVAAAGAALTYLTQWASGAEFGDLTPLVAAALAVLANLLRKLVTA